MRVKMLALAGAFLLVAGAAKADDVMANTYANTIHTKDTASGLTGTLMFNADGTYTGTVTPAGGQTVNWGGTWKVDGGNICLTPATSEAQAAVPPSCSPVASHNVGDSWTVTNSVGQTYEVNLAAGR